MERDPVALGGPSMTTKVKKRCFRVIDMMISMHSALRDRYASRALWMDILQLLFSVVLGATVFMSPERIGLDQVTGDWIIGGSALAIFFLGLVNLRVDWKEEAGKYGESTRVLSRLKGECRALHDEAEDTDPTRMKFLCAECRRALPELPTVPERDFAPLKAHHLRKIELSKLIDVHPGASFWVLRLVLWLRANGKSLSAEPSRPKENGEKE